MRTTATLAIAVLAAGWIAAAGHPALAYNGDRTLDAAVAAMPHSDPVQNGVAVGTGQSGGHPEFVRTGEPTGNLSAGYPVVVGEDGQGRPIIEHLAQAQ